MDHVMTLGETLSLLAAIPALLFVGFMLFCIYAIWHVNKYGN